MTKWKPISTAPKDGTKILVGRFFRGKPDGQPNNLIEVDYWHSKPESSYDGFGRFNTAFWPATHWMPLPNPPE